jgi:hypothetical protein
MSHASTVISMGRRAVHFKMPLRSMIRRFFLSIAILSTVAVVSGPHLLAAQDGSGTEVASSDGASSKQTNRMLVDYRGQLQDGQGEPISGVFHVAFKLYKGRNTAEPLWSERQYVAVTEGTYVVPLGSERELTRTDISGERWIGVELVGEGEILRDRFKFENTRRAGGGSGGSGGKFGVSKETKKLIEKAKNSKSVAFADVAERAISADKAKVAERAEKIGSMSADKIKRLSNLALERLGEHIADPNAHKAAGSKLGDRRRVMDRVGGTGGASYTSTCPEGYVVTGIRGGAGRVLDSIRIICQPLQ